MIPQKNYTNQEIIEAVKRAKDIINSSIYINQTYLVNQLRNDNFDSIEIENVELNYDDVKNYEYEILEMLKEKELIHKNTKILSLIKYEENEEEINDYLKYETDIEYSKKEFYEAWLVDSFMLNKLEEEGELIINYKDCEQWWGRQTTGQTIWLDGVIQDIVLDLASSFLEGLDIEKEARKRKLNDNSKYLGGFICNIDYIELNN